MAIYEVDPITRIEGHLGVKLDTGGGSTVVSANVHGNLWRGFENFLIGRDPNDAITFTQRICGVCPLPHATASMFAVESVLGYNDGGITFAASADGKGVPAKAVHIRNIVYASEFLMSAITHFYHLAAPSYIQGPNVPPWTPFLADGYYHPLLTNTSAFGTGNATAVSGLDSRTTLPANAADGFSKDLWSAVIKQYVHALRIRRLALEAGALFAGRMPMVSAFVAGGTTNDTNDGKLGARCTAFRSLMQEIGTFIVKEYVPVALALGALYPNYDNLANATTADSVTRAGDPDTLWGLVNGVAVPGSGNTGYGAGYGNFLSWGAFPNPADDTLAIKGGYKYDGSAAVTTMSGKSMAASFVTEVQTKLTENIARSHYSDFNSEFGTDDAAYPGDVSRTKPNRTAPTGFAGKYSWLKAPRWDGHPMEVGPLARMVVNGLYPTTGTLLANGIGTLYGLYVHPSGDGLDPRMVAPDIAVALVRSDLATLTIGSGAPIDKSGLPGTNAAIVAAYQNPATRITGIIFSWIAALAGGKSIMDRHRARALEALFLATKLIGAPTKGATDITWPGTGGWIGDLASATGGTFTFKATPTTTVSGFGVSEAPRGALAHFITIDKGIIAKYQCVVPTTWNASPKDQAGQNGPMEQAMIGIPFAATNTTFTTQAGGTGSSVGGVEALRVAQSFDPCIACAVH